MLGVKWQYSKLALVLLLALVLSVLNSCGLITNVDGEGYGGSDPEWTRISSAKSSISQYIELIDVDPDSLCSAQDCEGDSNVCNVLEIMTPVMRERARSMILNQSSQVQYLSILQTVALEVSDVPLSVDNHYVDAMTKLGPEGPIYFYRESVKAMSDPRLQMVLAHEATHKLDLQSGYITDEELSDAVGACIAGYGLGIVGKAPASFWEFDSNTSDSSTGGNEGVVIGTGFSTGKFNQALQLDGIDDYVNLSNPSNLGIQNEQITISAFIKQRSEDKEGLQGIMRRGTTNSTDAGIQNYELIIDHGMPRFNVGSGEYRGSYAVARSQTDISDGEWHHVAAVLDGDTLKIYIDGVLRGSETKDFLAGITSYHHVIGYLTYKTASSYFKGQIDDVKIWTRALSPTEIANEANR